MRSSVVALLLLVVVSIPLAGGFATRESVLRSHSAATPALAAEPEPEVAPACVPVLTANPTARYVALSWTTCPDAAIYRVFRGPSVAELVPRIEVNHASHIDVGALDADHLTLAYAVQADDGPLSAPAVVALD